MERLGCGYEQLAALNPRLVYLALKGYLAGPYEHRPALDEVVQFQTGLAFMTGPPGQARVRVLPDAPRPLRHGAHLLLHTGTAEVSARAIVLEADAIEPGAEGWVQLWLAEPLAAADGDRFVLRVPSPSLTLAGGRFADVAARRHPRHDAQVARSLERRVAGDVLQEELRKYPRGITETALLKATLAPDADLGALDARRAGSWLFAPEAWAAISRGAEKPPRADAGGLSAGARCAGRRSGAGGT